MVAQTIETKALAPWWSEAKCLAHQPYPTPRAAQRAAELHPISVRFCPKCADGFRIEPFRCHSDPSHWHCGHNLALAQEDDMVPIAITPQPVVPPAGARKAVRHVRPPSFTDEQAREIFRLVKDGRPKNVVAHEYGAKWWTIHQIAEGNTYRAATEALRNGSQEAPVQITTPPTVIERDDDYQAMKDAHVATITEMHSAGTSGLLADLADAAEWLLEQQGTSTAPRFVLTAIRILIAQARSVTP